MPRAGKLKDIINSLITSVLERKELSFPPSSLWGAPGIYLGQNPLRKVVTTYVIPVLHARAGFSLVLIFPTHYLPRLHTHTETHKHAFHLLP